jgi:hypothetical protein
MKKLAILFFMGIITTCLYASDLRNIGVSYFNGRSGVVLPLTNDYTWAQINKDTSSLADITIRNLSDLMGDSIHRTVTDTQIGTWDAKQAALNGAFVASFNTRTGIVIPEANDYSSFYLLLAGRSGGQTLYGGLASGESLTLSSNQTGTKGQILFGTSAYDEVNNRLGIGTTSPISKLYIQDGGIKLAGAMSNNGGIEFLTNNSYTDNIGIGRYINKLLFSGGAYLGGNTRNISAINSAIPASFGSNGTVVNFNVAGAIYNFATLATESNANLIFSPNGTGNVIVNNGNVGIGTTAFGTSATKALGIGTGVAPTTAPADMIQLYSADDVAGNATPHFRTENGTVVNLNQNVSTLSAPTFAGLAVDTNSIFVDTTNHRVGIGTTNLGHPLEVVGDGANGTIFMRGTGDSGGNGVGFTVRNDFSTTGTTWTFASDNAFGKGFNIGTGVLNGLLFITPTGNVGMGENVYPKSTLHVKGSIAGMVSAQTGTYTLTNTDYLVTINSSSAIPIYLLACDSTRIGRTSIFMNLGAGDALITSAGSDRIVGGGSTALSVTVAYQHMLNIVCDGAGKWAGIYW